MAPRRSLAALRERRAQLIEEMGQHRAMAGKYATAALAQLPEREAARDWIARHPMLSVLGAFTAGFSLVTFIASSK